jgi:hypothetical protein
MRTTKKSERPSMSTVIWVDSRRRVSGTDSDFKFELRETVTLQDARVRVDKVNFTDSFLTTDSGNTLYFSDGAGGLTTNQIPEGAYTGSSLSSAIQAATGRTTFYTALTNTITHSSASSSQPWLSDEELEASYSSGYPSGASSQDPRSLNAVLGDGTNSGSQVVWPFVRMSPFSYVFLKSTRLQCQDHHGQGALTTFCVRFH